MSAARERRRRDPLVELIGRAVLMGLAAVRRDPRQVLGQVVGRLRVAGEDAVRGFVERVVRYGEEEAGSVVVPASRPWIRRGARAAGWEGHSSVYAVAWSPDGSKVASGSYDNTVRVWDAGTGSA